MLVTADDSIARRFDTDAGVRATLVAVTSLAARLYRTEGAALCLTRDGTLEVVAHTGTLRSVRDVLARCRQIVQGTPGDQGTSSTDVSAVPVVGLRGEVLGALGVTGSRARGLVPDPDVLLALIADHVASLVSARAVEAAHHVPTEGQVSVLLADSAVALVELGPDGVVHHANHAAAALARDGNPTGHRLDELVVPTDREAVRAAVDDLATGRATSRQLTARYLGGGSTPVAGLTTVSVVRGPEGEPLRLVAVVADQTLQEAELADVTAREQRSSGLLRAIPDAIVVCAHDGTIVEVNDQVGVLFGYRAEELVGHPIEILVPNAQAAAHRWHRSTFTATPHAAPMITGPGITGRRKDGTLVPVEVNLAAVDLSSGPVVVACVRDVTESRRTARRLRATHDLMSDILGAATEQAVIAVTLDGMVDLFSRGAERLLGWTADEVLGTPVSRFVHPDADSATTWGVDARLSLPDRVRALVGSGIAATRPSTITTRAGDRRSVLVSVTVRHGESGPTGLIVVATDQTARLRQEKELEASEARFRLAFDNAPVGVALVSARPGSLGRYLQVNTALVELLGYPERELLGATVQSITHLEDLPDVVSTLGLLADGTVGSSRLEHRYSHVTGRDVWANVSLSVVRDADGAADYFVAQVADVTERKRAEAELTHNALHDTLTGLPNRMLLTESLARAQARAERTGTGVGVLYIDLDNFKDVNDSLGHAAGDELLVAIALRLTSCMRDSDTAGRLGGDEFVVICEDLARLDEVTAVADRVTRALAVQLPVAGRLVTIS
ncbi:MAG TPA: PAS domain S-box protein, partial [Cellulomonadaceae bacterium]|nr:PAS domain S-box protein [Cellulomonadaceae bacterium]